ncbi:claudin-9-like [Clupea harengus]|uniref:Claudin n=1 Tax=Clupea harengus TaxID=7950 RepID=A0A6P8F105_CLUHA|nr:claudin-9-like [Clupea harengus]
MATTGLQVLGVLLAVAGWVGGALVTAAPFWRVSAFVGGELVVAEAQWEGLWMSCLVRSSTGHTQCKTFDSGLALAPGTQARRALAIVALLLGLRGLGLAVLCTHCLGGAHDAKARLARAGGLVFVAVALTFLVPVSWTAHMVVRDFYDPAVAVMLVGGALINAGSAPPPEGGGGGGGGGRSSVAGAFGGGKGNPQPTPPAGKKEKAYV